MRVTGTGRRIVLTARPYQGSTEGASLYVGTPDENSINYRRNKSVSPGQPFRTVGTKTITPGAAGSIPKTRRVAFVTNPTQTINYTLPAALVGVPVAFQVRTFRDDLENEQIYRPVVTGTDGSGNQSDTIQGTATILDPIKLDGGGVRVKFVFTASAYGIQPTQFALVQTAGPGSLPDAVITAAGSLNSIDIAGLTNATAYGWNLQARNGAVSVVLGAVTFTADSAGPSGVSAFAAVVD